MASATTKINDKMNQLTHIRDFLTADFLNQTPLDSLKLKRTQVLDIVNRIVDLWEKTNPEDYPDAETVGGETKKEQAFGLRDEISAILDPRIQKLEEEIEAAKLAGAKQVLGQKPGTSFDAEIANLRSAFESIREENKNLKTFMSDATEGTLELKLKLVQTLHGNFLAKYNDADLTKLSDLQKQQWEHQRDHVLTMVEAMEDRINDRIHHLEKKGQQQVKLDEINAEKEEIQKLLNTEKQKNASDFASFEKRVKEVQEKLAKEKEEAIQLEKQQTKKKQRRARKI